MNNNNNKINSNQLCEFCNKKIIIANKYNLCSFCDDRFSDEDERFLLENYFQELKKVDVEYHGEILNDIVWENNPTYASLKDILV